METSRPFSKIRLDDRLIAQIRDLEPASRKAIGEAINQAAEEWGKPHLHSGTGIRKLNKTYFECRSGLQTRLVFKLEGGFLYFVFMGNHDEIRRFLRSNR